MKTKLLSLFALCFAMSMCVTNASAISRYVKTAAAGTADGSSWENASANIQTMINASASGDTVQIAAGKYLIAATIQGKDGVNLFGAYPANATTGNALRDLATNQTILDGQNARRIFTGPADATVTSLITNINGLIFQRGYSASGSAIWMYFGTVVENCIIRNNNSDGTNGAAVCVTGIPISGSTNFNTGALINCLIINNSSTASDGGAGGVYVFPSTYFAVVNCTFGNNFCADALGAGGLNYYAASSMVCNSIFYQNSAPNASPDVFYQNIKGYKQLNRAQSNWYDAPAVPANFLNSTSYIAYCQTNAATPEFENPTTFNGYDATKMPEIEATNWKLKSTSKLLNLGKTDAITNPYANMGMVARTFASVTTDLMGAPRVSGTKPDLGCYEFQIPAGINNVVESGLVTVKGRSIEMLQSVNSITVYNAVGATIYSKKNVTVGTSISMNRSGIYVVKVNTENGIRVQKIILQ